MAYVTFSLAVTLFSPAGVVVVTMLNAVLVATSISGIGLLLSLFCIPDEDTVPISTFEESVVEVVINAFIPRSLKTLAGTSAVAELEAVLMEALTELTSVFLSCDIYFLSSPECRLQGSGCSTSEVSKDSVLGRR